MTRPAAALAPPVAVPAAKTAADVRLIALVVASAMFMEQLDGTVLATALPAMAASFGVDPLRMSVALTSYLLSLAVFIPASGRAADRFGARRVFCAAIALFTLGSMLCGVAVNLPMLVASRILQGIGGAMMMPVGRLVLLRSVPRADLVAAMSWALVPGLIGPVVGPPLGGFLTDTLSWRWIFYINVPIGVLGITLALRYIDDVRETRHQPFDGLGMLLSGAALSCLMFGFELASRGAASRGVTAAMLLTGLAAGAAYMRHASHIQHPILDLRLMRVKSFALSLWAGSFSRITTGALPFLLPMMMQLGFGMSATRSGVITFASAAGAMLMKAAGVPLLRRYGFRNVLIFNGIIATLFLMSAALFRPGWPLWTIYTLLLAGGFFQSLQFTAYNTVAYANISAKRMSAATSFYTTFQQLMLSAGICTAATVLSLSAALNHHALPALADFSTTWIVLGLITFIAVPICVLLPRGVGDDMTGRRRMGERSATHRSGVDG
jgi:EmrB/QacA subfamily drug resistance transporter